MNLQQKVRIYLDKEYNDVEFVEKCLRIRKWAKGKHTTNEVTIAIRERNDELSYKPEVIKKPPEPIEEEAIEVVKVDTRQVSRVPDKPQEGLTASGTKKSGAAGGKSIVDGIL